MPAAPISWRERLAPLREPLFRARWMVGATILGGWGKFFLPLALPWAAGRVIDQVLPAAAASPGAARQELLWLAAILVGAALAMGVATWFRHSLATRIGAETTHLLRRRLFHHLQRLSMAFFARHHAGALGARVSSDINQAGMLIERGVIQYAMDGVFFVALTGFLLWQQWLLTLVAYAFIAGNAVTLWWFTPRLRRQQKAVQESQSGITGQAAEIFSAISLVKAYAGERESGLAFHERSEHMRELQFVSARLHGTFNALSVTLLLLASAATLIIGAWLVIDGHITKGQLVAFLLYLGTAAGTVQRMVDNLLHLQEGFAALERIVELQRVQPEPDDAPDAVEPPIAGAVELRGITFAYPGGEPVLHQFSFRFQRGRTYALVGPSGSGKSSICQLLLRFYDPQSGAVEVDGHDLRRVKQTWWRSHIAIVLQDPIIFSATVRDNIDFAIEQPTREQVEAAAQAAQAHDFITRLPEGYDTRLGERGVNLSGGQRQRIAIARALMRDPKLLILDEATSALDTTTERSIQEVIDRLRSTRTVVVVAHRLSTVRNVDEILVLDRGRLVEHGSWEDLMVRNGAFARLVAAHGDSAL